MKKFRAGYFSSYLEVRTGVECDLLKNIELAIKIFNFLM